MAQLQTRIAPSGNTAAAEIAEMLRSALVVNSPNDITRSG